MKTSPLKCNGSMDAMEHRKIPYSSEGQKVATLGTDSDTLVGRLACYSTTAVGLSHHE